MKLLAKKEQITNGIISASKRHIGGCYEEHGHDFFEIEYIIHGNGTYIIDGKSYPIKDKMLFFMSPSNFHALENYNAEIINIMFSCNIYDTNTLFSILSKPSAILISEEDSVLIENMLKEIVTSSDTDYAVQFLRCILYKLSSMMPQEKNKSCSHIQSTIVYLLENFRSNVTLESAAKHIGLTPAYLSSLFLQETGTNFKVYLDNLRFDYAIKLLIYTDMSVLEICNESGFYDYANFTRRFKKNFTLTPSEYRKKHTL